MRHPQCLDKEQKANRQSTAYANENAHTGLPTFIEKNLLFRAAGTQRYAGEGELVFGLTRHGVIVERAAGCVKGWLLRF
jgi:hypothetical protein